MSNYRIKLNGTTLPTFDIGLSKFTFDTAAISSPWTLTLPAGPGAAGYVLSTDGSGVTSWVAVGSAADSTVPYFIPAATSFIVNENKQALFGMTIDVEGTLEVNGILLEVS
jgi:hypothetical protein